MSHVQMFDMRPCVYVSKHTCLCVCCVCVRVLYIFVCCGPLCKPIVGPYSFVPFGIAGFCKEGKLWLIFRNTFLLQKIPALFLA